MKKSTVSRPDLATKITEFINDDPEAVTIQLWRFPENGGYSELELTNPTANAESETLSISDLNDTTQLLNIDIQNIASINYSTNWLTITLADGECIKLVREV